MIMFLAELQPWFLSLQWKTGPWAQLSDSDDDYELGMGSCLWKMYSRRCACFTDIVPTSQRTHETFCWTVHMTSFNSLLFIHIQISMATIVHKLQDLQYQTRVHLFHPGICISRYKHLFYWRFKRDMVYNSYFNIGELGIFFGFL